MKYYEMPEKTRDYLNCHKIENFLEYFLSALVRICTHSMDIYRVKGPSIYVLICQRQLPFAST